MGTRDRFFENLRSITTFLISYAVQAGFPRPTVHGHAAGAA